MYFGTGQRLEKHPLKKRLEKHEIDLNASHSYSYVV